MKIVIFFIRWGFFVGMYTLIRKYVAGGKMTRKQTWITYGVILVAAIGGFIEGLFSSSF